MSRLSSMRTEGWAARAAMPPSRLALVGILLGVYIVFQAYQVITESDDWPFSSYPMYSSMQGPVARRFVLVGVGKDGEFALKSAHSHPLNGARLRQVVKSLDSKRGKRVLAAFRQRYEERNAELGFPWPELHGLRQYELTWRISPRLEGIKKPKKRRLQSVLALSPSRERSLLAESNGQAPPPELRLSPPSDVVLQAHQAQRIGDVKIKRDAYAALGEALVFPNGVDRQKPAATPKHAARFTFVAEPGRYWIWLRGKSSKGDKQDSVWVAVGKQVGSRNTSFRKGAGNFRDGYPVNAFAWSSALPADPPVQVKLKGRNHQLVLSPREGPVTIDQVVLSKQWREHPQDDGPVVQK